MKFVYYGAAISFAFLLAFVAPGCRRKRTGFVIATSESIVTLDPMGGPNTDLGSERMRQLMFNSLVRKDEHFDYVGELASNIQTAPDGLSVTFTLHDGVKFHDGRPLTATDAKYTLDTLLASHLAKANNFFEGVGAARQGFVTGVEAPDARTLIIRLRKPWLQLLINLVPVGIIPNGSAATQKDKPMGSGPFAFVSYNPAQQTLELKANEQYWEGAPKIAQLRVVSIKEASALQSELLAGRVDCALNTTNLTADIFQSFKQNANFQVTQFPGANIVYVGFNVTLAPLNDAKFRRAVVYAINREGIIHQLLLDQAKLAHSILPEESWAYAAGETYAYDPEKSKKLLDELGFRDPDGDGPAMRLAKPVVIKISNGSIATRQYTTTIQDDLKKVGIPVEIETLEANTLTDQQVKGEYQMTTRMSVGGNQDPIFFRYLFATSSIPPPGGTGFNRTRYSNPALDAILDEAANTSDRNRAKELYAQAQAIVSRDLPMFTLWYPGILVIAKKNVGNIAIPGDGDWSAVRKFTVQ